MQPMLLGLTSASLLSIGLADQVRASVVHRGKVATIR